MRSMLLALPKVASRAARAAHIALPALVAAGFTAAVAISIVITTPRPEALACAWNPYHGFQPGTSPGTWCRVQDQNSIRRTNQHFIRVAAGKMTTLGIKIQEVKREIAQWQAAHETALSYEGLLRRAYGDMTTSPLPSLAFAYNSTPMGGYYRVGENGRGEFVDIRRAADSTWQSLQDATNVRALYSAGSYTLDRSEENSYWVGAMLQDELSSLADWEVQSANVRDTLMTMGMRSASRYSNESGVAGLAEARISAAGSRLTALRGVAHMQQAQSIAGRSQALSAAAETQRRIIEFRVKSDASRFVP